MSDRLDLPEVVRIAEKCIHQDTEALHLRGNAYSVGRGYALTAHVLSTLCVIVDQRGSAGDTAAGAIAPTVHALRYSLEWWRPMMASGEMDNQVSICLLNSIGDALGNLEATCRGIRGGKPLNPDDPHVDPIEEFTVGVREAVEGLGDLKHSEEVIPA